MSERLQEDSRCDQYRDLLEHWAAWWNGPGREGYQHSSGLLPPIERTGGALSCTICAGITDEDEGRCQVCGRKIRAF